MTVGEGVRDGERLGDAVRESVAPPAVGERLGDTVREGETVGDGLGEDVPDTAAPDEGVGEVESVGSTRPST